MIDGSPSPDLPFIHKEGLQLIQATYRTQDEAAQKITNGLDRLLSDAIPGYLEQPEGESRKCSKNTRNHIQTQRVSQHESHMGNLSEQYRAHGLSGLLSVSRWQSYGEERKDTQQRL